MDWYSIIVALCIAGTAIAARALFRAKQAGAMATMSRLLLLVGTGLWVVLAVVASFSVFPQLMVLGIFGLYYFGKKGLRFGRWSHGTARFATVAELAEVGALEGRDGLLVGKVPPPSIREGIAGLWGLSWWNSRGACELFLASLLRRERWVVLNLGPNAAIFAPPGAGKSRAVIIPHLLRCTQNIICIDIKGELAAATAVYRHHVLGQEIILLDPFHLVTDRPDSFNPLDAIQRDSPYALDDIRALANDLVVRTGKELDEHWNDASEMVIGAAVALAVAHLDPKGRNLQLVASMIASPEGWKTARQAMLESDAWDGLLTRLGGQVSQFEGREQASVQTTTARHLRHLSTPAIRAVTQSSSFDPLRMNTDLMTVYIVIPPDKLGSLSGLLRMWLGSFMRIAVRGGLR